MNPIHLINNGASSFPASLSGSLNTNTTHKKILVVVLAALAFLSTCYFLCCYYSSLKTKKVKQEKQNQKLPQPQPQALPNLIHVGKQIKNDKANQGAAPFQLEPETEDESVMEKEKDDKEAQAAFSPQPELHQEEAAIEKKQEDDSPQLEVPYNQTVVEKEKEKDRAPVAAISSWDELESFCNADEHKDLKALEIPGQGIVSRKHVVRLLDHKTQLPAWDSLQEQSVKLADGEIKLSGLTKAALCLDNLDFRDFFQDINDNKADLTDLSTAEWHELVNARLTESQAVDFLHYPLVQRYPCFHKRLQSLLNRKDRLFSLPATGERLQLIARILDLTQTAQFPTLNQACKDYFARALTLPETDCAAFYQLIQHDPILVNAFFDAVDKACEGWGMPADQKQAIGQKLLTILSQLEEDKKLIYFERFLKSCHHEELSICSRFKEFLAKLTDQDEQDLAQLIADQAENPGIMGRQWIDSLDRDKKKDNINRILTTIIPALDNIQNLKEVIGTRHYIENRILKHLTLDQYKILIPDWQTNLSPEEAFTSITTLIFSLYGLGVKGTDTIEQILPEFPTIKLKKLLAHFKDQPMAPYIGSLYVLNSLNSDQTNGEKEGKMLIALAHMSCLAGGYGNQDDHSVFARLLAKKCSDEQAGLVINGFHAYSNRGNTQRLGVSFLTTILESENLEKIKNAFQSYWRCWKSFNEQTGCSALILPSIKSEEVLKAVYQAIPTYFSSENKSDIRDVLRKPVAYNNLGRMEDYRVDLDQAIINRIVV